MAHGRRRSDHRRDRGARPMADKGGAARASGADSMNTKLTEAEKRRIVIDCALLKTRAWEIEAA